MKHPRPVEYLVSEDGRRTGVVLRWEDYEKLTSQSVADPDLLYGMNEAELRALATGMLASPHDERLNGLLARNQQGRLSVDEARELDELVNYLDQMNVLKARALLTLQRLNEEKEAYE
jgi:hypothetical protein